MASSPHIKEDPLDWAAAAAHEGGCPIRVVLAMEPNKKT